MRIISELRNAFMHTPMKVDFPVEEWIHEGLYVIALDALDGLIRERADTNWNPTLISGL
jgi:hypothetical protein